MFRSVAGFDNEAPQIRHFVSAFTPPLSPVSQFSQTSSQGGGDLTWMGDTHTCRLMISSGM